MPRHIMQWTKPTVKVATTQAGLTSGLAIECQVNVASLDPVPSDIAIASTGCTPATNAPGATAFVLNLTWLQDWNAGDESKSLSRFAFLHDTEAVWVSMIPNAAAPTDSPMTGQFFCRTGGFGGTFGDGSAASTTAAWNAVDKPVIGPAPVTPLEADAEAAAA